MISPGTARNGPGRGRSEEEIDVSDATRPAPTPASPATKVMPPATVNTPGPTEVKEGYPLSVAWPEPAAPAAADSLIVAPSAAPPVSAAPDSGAESSGNS